jgi:hypothetical protein
MQPNYDCPLYRSMIHREIAAVFDREPRWLGMYQVRQRLQISWASAQLWYSVWIDLIHRGILIESFAPNVDPFPRYLLARLSIPPGVCHDTNVQ